MKFIKLLTLNVLKNLFNVIQKIIFVICVFFIFSACSSTPDVERKEGIYGDKLRIYEKIDLLFFPEKITDKEYSERIKLLAMKRAFRIINEYFYFKSGRRVNSQNEVKLFQRVLKKHKIHIITETDRIVTLFADFDIKLLNDYLKRIEK